MLGFNKNKLEALINQNSVDEIYCKRAIIIHDMFVP